MSKNSHIRFEENNNEESSSDDQDERTLEESESWQRISVAVCKRRKESSFGFEISGDHTTHQVESVDPGKPADRAHLERGDRIVSVNGVNTEKFSVNQLIDLLEAESQINSFKLNLVVIRKCNTVSDTTTATTSGRKRTLNETINHMGKRKRQLSQANRDSSPPQGPSINLIGVGNLNAGTPESDSTLMSSFVPAVQLERQFAEDTFKQESSGDDFYTSIEHQRQDRINQVKFVSASSWIAKKPHVPSRQLLNSKAREIQTRLSEQGKFVTWQEIIHELLELYYDCNHLGDLGLSQADNLETIQELLRLQRRVDSLIIAYEARVPLLTIVDLEKLIVTDYNFNLDRQQQQYRSAKLKISKFEELFLGPLIKNLLVRRIFHLEDDVVSIKQLKPINATEVLKHLSNYLRDNNLWASKTKVSGFETYLVNKSNATSMKQIGVKITNIGALIGSLKTVQHFYSELLKTTRDKIEIDYKTLLSNEKMCVIKQMTERLELYKQRELDRTSSGLVSQLSSNLAHLKQDSTELIIELVHLYDNLLDRKDCYTVKGFLNVFKTQTFLRDAFQLGLCLAKHDLVSHLDQIESNLSMAKNRDNYLNIRPILERVFFLAVKKRPNREIRAFLSKHLKDFNLKVVSINSTLFPDEGDVVQSRERGKKKATSTGEEADDVILVDSGDEDTEELSDSFESVKLIDRSIGDLEQRLADLINNKLEAGSVIDFDHLSRIEKAVYQNDSYDFVDLLSRKRQLFEQKAVEIVLINSEKKKLDESMTQASRVDKEHLLDYLQQLQANLKDNPLCKLLIERLVCSYLSLKSIEECPYGGLENLIQLADKKVEDDSPCIVYQDSILHLTESCLFTDSDLDQIKIIQELDKCPLLDNVYEYMNWSDKYSGRLGSLKEYLINLNRKKVSIPGASEPFAIQVLETEPGVLLKLTKNTSIKQLKPFIEQGKSQQACGHLISLIAVQYKSYQYVPHALIVNEIQSSLSVYLKQCSKTESTNPDLEELMNSVSNQQVSTGISAKFFLFLADLITRVPMKLQSQIFFKFFLDPVVGITNDRQIKQKLFRFLLAKLFVFYDQCPEAVMSDHRVKYFLRLGQLCSISEWEISKALSTLDRFKTVKIRKHENPVKPADSINQNESPSPIKEDTQVTDHPTEAKTPQNMMIIDETSLEPIIPSSSPSLEINLSEQARLDHVNSIRRRYGIGVELNEQSQAVTDSLKGVIGRSLESLSHELYNKEMHFVLELIQNADDNVYSEVVEPTLVFLIENNKITLFNNENGFLEANVNAICDVKASTKGKHQKGYIGRKGIGFKSVFTVSDRPEIHSNGYHIQFNLDNGHIGYILPNWIGDSVDHLARISSMNDQVKERTKRSNLIENVKLGELNTCIHLPLKSESEMQRHKSSLMTNNFNDIKPYLLLFLNRLRNLVIVNHQPNSRELVYHRHDIDENLIEIRSNVASWSTGEATAADENSSTHWLVIRQALDVPDNLKPNETVESTDLCLAFPLDYFLNDSDAGCSTASMKKMDVFAYLPLRSFGFRFIIQADFVVPASRQDINQDSDWNQWIVRQIPDLFVNSLKQFQGHSILNQADEKSEDFKSLKAFIKFVPLEEEVVGFFNHIPRQIADRLRNEEFLPVTDMSDDDQVIRIVRKKPFECVIAKDEMIRQVLTSDLLKKHLGRYYLHPSLVESLMSGEMSLKLLTSLGVHLLDLADIVEILKTVFSSASVSHLSDTRQTAKWLVVLHHCFSNNSYSLQQEDKFLKQIKDIEFIPVLRYDYESNTMKNCLMSLNKCSVFFPNEKTASPTATSCKLVDSLEKDLNILDTESLLCLDQFKNAQIISILKTLGVMSIEPKSLIENHILKVFSDQSLLETRLKHHNEMLVLYLIYLSENFSFVQFNMNKVRDLVLIKTDHGFKKVLVQNDDDTESESSSDRCLIYLTSLYGNKYDLKGMFPSYAANFCFVDSIYLDKMLELKETTKSKKKTQIGGGDQPMLAWRKFFISLGLNDLFTPGVKLTQQETNQVESIYVRDYECPVTSWYLSQVETRELTTEFMKELTSLYRLIEENWQASSFAPRPLGSYKTKSIITSTKSRENSSDSSYFSQLKSTKWILAETHEYRFNSVENKVELESSKSVELPQNVYLKEQIFLHLYGLRVPYVMSAPHFKEPGSLSRDLMFKFEFNLISFLTQFNEWCQTAAQEGYFIVSIGQMRNIYLYLASQLDSYEIKPDAYEQLMKTIDSRNAFIFFPANSNTNEPWECAQVGYFISPNDAYWHDPTSLFEKYKSSNLNKTPALLKPIYYDSSASGVTKSELLRQAFLTLFQVQLKPSLDEYIELLTHVSLQANMGKIVYEQALCDVFKIYEILVDIGVEMSEDLLISTGNETELMHMEASVSATIRDKLRSRQVIPCTGNKWIEWNSKSQPVVADSLLELAEQFNDKINMVVTNPTPATREFTDLCGRIDQMSPKLAYFFYSCLELPKFSDVVILDLENITQNLREAPEVQHICSKIVPFIQSFFFYRSELGQAYKQLISETVSIKDNLAKMKFYSVKELENIYRFRHDPSIYINVSNRTCVETSDKSVFWKYFVRSDQVSSSKEIVRGFVQMFTKNSRLQGLSEPLDKYEKEMARFCLLMLEFSDLSRLGRDDRWDIEKEYGVKLELPVEEEKWSINDPNWMNKSNSRNEPVLDTASMIQPNMVTPVRNKSYSNNENGDGMSHRQKMIFYDKLSSNQINLPQAPHSTNPMYFRDQYGYDDRAINRSSPIDIARPVSITTHKPSSSSSFNNRSFSLSRSIDELDKSLSDMAMSKTGTMLRLDNYEQRSDSPETITVNQLGMMEKLSPTSMRSLNSLRDSIRDTGDKNPTSPEFLFKVGRWGEHWVFEWLKIEHQQEIESGTVLVEWMNETNESGLPYDVRVTHRAPNEPDKIKFIEVKSTIREDRETFQISMQELFFAQKFAEDFEIYRVYNATDAGQVSLRIVKNLTTLLNTNEANLYIVI